jgi:hypothetical protein
MNGMEMGMKKPNCWKCRYNNIKSPTFFGICTWFEKHNMGPNKEIPAKVVDIGCKHFSPRPGVK